MPVLLAGPATSGAKSPTRGADLPRTTSIFSHDFGGAIMVPLFLLSVFPSCLWWFISSLFVAAQSFRTVLWRGRRTFAQTRLSRLLAVSNRHSEAIARVVQKVSIFRPRIQIADFSEIREIAQTEGRGSLPIDQSCYLSCRYWDARPDAWFCWHSHRHHSIFRCVGSGSGNGSLCLLSRGISEALVNTAAGLAIGIPAMIFYAMSVGVCND